MSDAILPEMLEKIEAVAKTATPGPWLLWDDGDIGTAYPVERKSRARGGAPVKVTIESYNVANTSSPDADYLATVDPNTVLAIISRLKYLEAERKITHPFELQHEDNPHELIEEAMAELEKIVGNPNLAWSLWNSLNANKIFIKAFKHFNR